MSGFSALDWAVVVLYMGGIAAFGLLKGGKQASAKDYFLSEKKIGWWAVTASIVATETSALTFISVPGMAYKGSWGFLQLAFGYLLGRIVVAWILLPRYFEGELTTSYALIERTLGVGLRRLASGTFIVTRIFADGVRLYATAIPLAIIFRGYNLFSGVSDAKLYLWAILLTAAVTVVYVQVGGVRAVIWTDVIQLFVYILGGFVAVAVLVPKIPEFGVKLAAAAAAGKLTVFQTGGDFLSSPYHVLTAILGGAVLSMASHGTDYIIVQRLFSTESLRDSRRALVASGVVVILQFVLFLAVGTLLFLFYGPLSLNADAVFPKFIVEEVPSGLSGLIIAGLLAAAMSTLSGSISSISSSTVFDLYASTKHGRAASEERKLQLSRRVSFAWAILLTGAALIFIGTGQAVVELALSIASFTYGGFLGLFFLAVRGRSSRRAATAGFLAGVGVMVYVVFGTKLAWPFYTLAGSLVTVTVALALDGLWGGKAGDGARRDAA
jgi:SSS family transporter